MDRWNASTLDELLKTVKTLTHRLTPLHSLNITLVHPNLEFQVDLMKVLDEKRNVLMNQNEVELHVKMGEKTLAEDRMFPD